MNFHGVKIFGLAIDSRKVEPGFAFFASRGVSSDGHLHLKDAEQRGAAICVGEDPDPGNLLIPYIQVKNPRLALSEAASGFFEFPSDSLKVFGVTGTSGKTTSTYLLRSILQASGEKVGLIGTISIVYPDGKEVEATHTTPEAIEIQKTLSQMKSSGATCVVMEISSHALKQHRVAHVAIDGMIFTNLSAEHLDYHPDMEDYFKSKRMLFLEVAQYSKSRGKIPIACINSDDSWGERLFEEVKSLKGGAPARVFSFSAQELLKRGGLVIDGSGIAVGGLKSKLLGQFNAENLLGAIELCRAYFQFQKYSSEKIRAFLESGIANLKIVPGRLEPVANSRGVTCLVDYAHKPDALEKVLKTLKPLVKSGNKLITVFGCGGDRDRKKRPLMGAIAERESDLVIVTSDNPRSEDPELILKEILGGISKQAIDSGAIQVESDRKTAIERAASLAKAGDWILIAGKGHETYQILFDKVKNATFKVHFDDREEASRALTLPFENL